MTDREPILECQNSGADDSYETPRVTPVGNLNDLLLGTTGPDCDQVDNSARTGGGVC